MAGRYASCASHVTPLVRSGQAAEAVPARAAGRFGPGAHAVDDRLLALAEAVEYLLLELLAGVQPLSEASYLRLLSFP